MSHPRTSLKQSVISWSYQRVAKPIFFRFPPEFVHDRVSALGSVAGQTKPTRWLTRQFFDHEDPVLEQTVAGIRFRNPVGLAAGFDKKGKLVDILPDVGFGFAEIGSITWRPYGGNAEPRLTRLKKSNSIVVNYGLASEGAEVIAQRLEQLTPRIPIGISIAPSNTPTVATLDEMVTDVARTYERFAAIGAYTTLNLSCPNTHVDQPFMQPTWLDEMLKAVTNIPSNKPIFLKLSPDRPAADITKLLKIAEKQRVTGVIASNLTKPRNNPRIFDAHVPAAGGLSGRVVAPLANRLTQHIYQTFGDRFVIVGCGGIFSADDVEEKFRLGASLVQLATGMIFEGPQLIGAINRALAERIKTAGCASINEWQTSLRLKH